MGNWFSGSSLPDGVPALLEDVEEYTSESDIETDVLLIGGIEDYRDTDALAHHTSDFDQTKFFVVRRGQDFHLKVCLKRPYDPEKDEIRLTFQFGKEPNPFFGTHISLEPDALTRGWIAKLNSINTDSLEFAITANAKTCAVGSWRISVDTRLKQSKKTYRLTMEESVHILFNPWCKDDPVYMGDENGPSEAELEEYILNDTGAIYVGSVYSNYGRRWRFGQFDNVVLQAAEYLLQKEGWLWQTKKLSSRLRGNPIYVSRKLTALISGVIQGNWTDDFEGGTRPEAWRGSVKILEQFMKPHQEDPTKDAEMVRYGQCWVFSGLTTTLCRALGIPARSVTNFQSAHDVDSTADINLCFDEEGEFVAELSDSIWNFHVWNEVYFKRPDLSTNNKYDGWQVIDATPQEESEGDMQCGPAPLSAVKNGKVTKNYDSRFVFAEVNGDMHEWLVTKDGNWEFLASRPHRVGQIISTKMVGQLGRDVLTDYYKYPEGSEENETAVQKAKSLSERNEMMDWYLNIEVPLKVCEANHVEHRWSTSPMLQNGMYSTNLLSAASVLLSGNNYTKIALFAKFLGLCFPGANTFYAIQGKCVIPVVDQYWENIKQSILEEHRATKVIVSGDGRMDSPGHCAKYCTYTIMNQEDKSILAMEVVDKRETALKSGLMEARGFSKAVRTITDENIKIEEIVTDAHPQISSIMKKNYSDVKHSYDMWHGAKNLGKKISKISNTKGNEKLKPWVKDITNHFFHCAEMCNGSAIDMKDIEGKITLNQETVIGETLEVMVDFTNSSEENRKIDGTVLHVMTQYYTNKTHKKVKDIQMGEIILGPNEALTKSFQITFEEYYPNLTDFNMIAANLSCMVSQTGHHITDNAKTTLRKPSLNIDAPNQVKVQESFQVDVAFTNPLDIPLTNCMLTLEGLGFSNFNLNQSDLGPKAEYSLSFEQVCKKIGKKSMMVSFDSDELFSIQNVYEIVVEE